MEENKNKCCMFAAQTQMAEQTFRLFQSFCVGYMRHELQLFADIFWNVGNACYC